MLEAEAIIAEAEHRVGVEDSDYSLLCNLEALVASLNDDARLPAAGEAGARSWILGRTVDRLEGLRWLRDYREIALEPIAAPVFLTGLPRSGTTYFQFLFDHDSRFRLIRGWEAMSPSPPPGFDPASAQRRRAEEEDRRRAMRPPVENFDAMHLIDQGGPEECHPFLEQSYAAAGLNNLFAVPRFFDFLADQVDFEAAYAVHKRQLQLLQWRMETPRWALKYPNHVLAMDSILKVYPDARFVMTHRDPVQTLASIANLSLKLRQIRYDDPLDPHEVGRQMLHFVRRHIDRIMEFTGGPDADRVTHVDYYALLDDPAKAMVDVHIGLGLESPAQLQNAVARWRAANPKNARGPNDYSLEQFGLDTPAVAEQFGDYMRRFDIPREREGLSRLAG